MEPLQFAGDSALTPISELRQTAKARARDSGQKLSSALDEVAQTLSYPRWDALMDDCWTVQPPGSERNPAGLFEITRVTSNHRPEILIHEPGVDVKQLCLTVNDWQEEGTPKRLIYASNFPHLGRILEMTEEEWATIFSADTLQARIRATVPFVMTHADRVPRLVGPLLDRRERHAAAMSTELPEAVDTIQLAAEIPGTKNHFQVTLNIGDTRDALLSWLKTEQTPGLYDFKVQKDGRILGRRAKFETELAAKIALQKAIRLVSFLSWTHLEYPSPRAIDRAQSDKFKIGSPDLFDHQHTLSDRRSGATVILNQPYRDDGSIVTKGILNLLNTGTITSEAAEFTGLYEGTRVLFHSLEDQGADLEAIATGALNAELMTRQAEITLVQQGAGNRSAGSRPKTKAGAFLSPVGDLHFDLSDIPFREKVLLDHHLPSIKQLKTTHWRSKMKAFHGDELLSWDLQDKYQIEGVSETDVVEALQKCPFDADIWGFFEIFDLAETTKAECFRRGVIAGEIYLGRDTFKAEAGDFWHVHSTRPYMRAMNNLYRSLVKLERPVDALPLGKMILDLNKNDNIGIRFSIDDVEAAIGNATLTSELAEVFKDQDLENY